MALSPGCYSLRPSTGQKEKLQNIAFAFFLGGDGLERIPTPDDLSVGGQSEDVDAGIIVRSRPVLKAMEEDDKFPLGDYSSDLPPSFRATRRTQPPVDRHCSTVAAIVPPAPVGEGGHAVTTCSCGCRQVSSPLIPLSKFPEPPLWGKNTTVNDNPRPGCGRWGRRRLRRAPSFAAGPAANAKRLGTRLIVDYGMIGVGQRERAE